LSDCDNVESDPEGDSSSGFGEPSSDSAPAAETASSAVAPPESDGQLAEQLSQEQEHATFAAATQAGLREQAVREYNQQLADQARQQLADSIARAHRSNIVLGAAAAAGPQMVVVTTRQRAPAQQFGYWSQPNALSDAASA